MLPVSVKAAVEGFIDFGARHAGAAGAAPVTSTIPLVSSVEVWPRHTSGHSEQNLGSASHWIENASVEEKFAVSGALNTLEKLFGNDLVSIYVLLLERNDQAGWELKDCI